MENGAWSGRWSVGCAVMFAGGLFFVSLFVMLFAGDTVGVALQCSGGVAGLGLAGATMFGLLGYWDLRQRQQTMAAVRSRLEPRGAVTDEQACESVPIEGRPFFLQVRTAVAEFLGCPPEWLRASDLLEEDYRSGDFGWVELEWHVFERIRENLGYEFIAEDLINDQAVVGTLADLAEHLRAIFDALEPPPSDFSDVPDASTNPAP